MARNRVTIIASRDSKSWRRAIRSSLKTSRHSSHHKAASPTTKTCCHISSWAAAIYRGNERFQKIKMNRGSRYWFCLKKRSSMARFSLSGEQSQTWRLIVPTIITEKTKNFQTGNQGAQKKITCCHDLIESKTPTRPCDYSISISICFSNSARREKNFPYSPTCATSTPTTKSRSKWLRKVSSPYWSPTVSHRRALTPCIWFHSKAGIISSTQPTNLKRPHVCVSSRSRVGPSTTIQPDTTPSAV